MPRCTATKPDGERCERIVGSSQTYCYAHDPQRREQRRRAASKAGRSKPSRELSDLKQQLEDLTADMLAGRIERGVGSVVNQVLNTRPRLAEVERKVQETQELSEQVEELEAEIRRRAPLRGTL
jgi:hypothetical protein